MRAGAIVPMYKNDRTNDLSLEQPLEIHIWRGNGHYELYEDDGETNAYRRGIFAKTEFDLVENSDKLRLTITPPSDSKGLLPSEREMVIKFRDVVTDDVTVKVGNEPVVIEIENIVPTKNEDKNELKNAILTRIQGSNAWKNRVFSKKKMPLFLHEALSEFECLYYE